jgi:hypothetical protein
LTALQANGEAFCVVYQMRHPFAGRGVDCGGEGGSLEGVGYAPGTTAARVAEQKVCALVAADLSRKCETNDVALESHYARRDQDGAFRYGVTIHYRLKSYPQLIEVRPGVSNIPVVYGEKTYEVDAQTGELQLLSNREKFCAFECVPFVRLQ